MIFTPTKLSGVWLIESKVNQDERGFFMESYREDVFANQGFYKKFVQDNHSASVKGVLRGLHYQTAPFEQAKLVRVTAGEVLDVAVDIRPKSKTFGQWVSQILSADNKKMMLVDVGFAHGYLTLSDKAEVQYKVTSFYSPGHERGLKYDDAELKIEWPHLNCPITLSEKDKKNPPLFEIKR